MGLTVSTAKPQGKLTVVNNYGMQGSTYNPQGNNYNPQPATYNPQKTAPSTVLQRTWSPQRTAGGFYSAKPIQLSVAQKAQLQREAEERARQEAIRVEAERKAASAKKINAFILQVKTASTNLISKILKVENARQKMSKGFNYSLPSDLFEGHDMIEPIKPQYFPLQEKMFYMGAGYGAQNRQIAEENRQIREQDFKNFEDYLTQVDKYEGLMSEATKFNQERAQQRAYREKYNELLAAETADKKAGFFGKVKNWFTGGATQGKRDQVLAELEKDNTDFAREADTAKNQLELENKRYMEMLQKKLSEGDLKGFSDTYNEYDKYMRSSEKQFGKSVIEHHAKLSASQDWYGKHTGRKGLFGDVRDKAGTGLTWATNVLDIPRRGVNTVRNFVNPDGERTYYDGTRTKERIKSLRQAWNASMNQHVVAPHKKVDWNDAEKKKAESQWTKPMYDAQFAMYKARGFKTTQSYDDWVRDKWHNEQSSTKFLRGAADFVADPLIFAGAASKGLKGVKGLKLFDTLSDVTKGSKLWQGSKGLLEANKLRAATWLKSEKAIPKALRWAGTPASTAGERYRDVLEAGRTKQAALQTGELSRLRALDKKLNGRHTIDYKVFDDIGRLSNNEAKALQRIVDGKFYATDRLRFAGKENSATRAKLLDIAQRYQKITDLEAAAAKMRPSGSRWLGKGRKGQYFADTRWTHRSGRGLDAYDFRLRKKRGGIQSAEDLARSQVDRLLKSDVETWLPQATAARKGKVLEEIKKVRADYGAKYQALDDEIADAWSKTRTKGERAKKIAGMPMGLWKKSVLKYSPRWHINNLLWNLPASFAAGGKGTAKTYGKIVKAMAKERTLTPKILAELPDDIVKKGIMGKQAASKIESFSRGASYKTLVDKGMTPAQATKRTNQWLFDYTTKNWERPLKSVFPFWHWYKGLAKLGVTMPFHSPKAAGKFSTFKREMIDKPSQAVGNDTVEYKDPETGEIIKYNNSARFKGKIKIPFTNKYMNTPFFPLNDSKVGLNPALAFWEQHKSGVDTFGMDSTKKSLFERLTTYFPQADLINKGYKVWDMKRNPNKYTRDWVAESGSTKHGQGSDPSKSNYMKSLDPRDEAKAAVGSFLGLPRTKEFNIDEHKRKQAISQFQKEYFKEDWDKYDWKERNAKQEALAKKHGFTLDEIYKHWARFDSDTTVRDKGLKQEARRIANEFWTKYESLPKGEKGKSLSERAPFVLKTIENWLADGTFAKNRHLVDTYFKKMLETYPQQKTKRVQTEARIAKAKEYAAKGSSYGTSQKRADYQEAVRTGNWKPYHNKYGIKSPKAKFWNTYWSESDPSKRRALLRANPQFSNRPVPTEAEIEEAKFWKKYTDADRETRRQLLADNPKYNRRADWTDEQWDRWKDEQKKKQRADLFSLFGDTTYKNFLAANTFKAGQSNVRRIRNKKTAVAWKY